PAVAGGHIYLLGTRGRGEYAIALDAQDGHQLWATKLGAIGKSGPPPYAESPLIDGNVLVCTPGSAKASLAALDKATGAVIWTSEIPDAGEAAYASAIVAEAGGVKQYVQLLRNGVVGVAAKDGKPLWRFDKTATVTNCSTPIFHDGYLYSS